VRLGALALAAAAIVAGCSSRELSAPARDQSGGPRRESALSPFLEGSDYLIEKTLGVYVVMAVDPLSPLPPGKKDLFGMPSSVSSTSGRVTLYLQNPTDSETALLIQKVTHGPVRVSVRAQEIRIAPRSRSRVEAGVVSVDAEVRDVGITVAFGAAGSEDAKMVRLRRVTQDRFPRPGGLVFPWDPDPICGADADRDYVEACLAWRKGETARALGTLRPLAERGSASAQWLMGLIHDVTLPVDFAAAVQWYRKSAEQGYAPGQSALAGMYALGRIVPQDYGEALRWYRKAAAQGDGRAEHAIGFMYEAGQGVAIDLAEAATWYRKAAEKGYPQAQTALAAMYYAGRGVEKDLEKARYWLEKAAARGSLIALEGLESFPRK